MSHARRSLLTEIRQRHVRLVHHMHKTIDNRETARNKHKINFIVKNMLSQLSALSSQSFSFFLTSLCFEIRHLH